MYASTMRISGIKRMFSSLRARLVLLVLAAMAPAFVFIVHSAVQQRTDSVAEMHEHAREIAQDAATEEQELFSALRQLLMTLTRLPDIRTGSLEEFRRIGNDLIRDDPRIHNIARVDLDGNTTASVIPLTRPVNVADRPYFRNAIKTGGIGIGDYQIGRITGKATLNFAYPIRDRDGKITGILYAALNLDWLNREQATRTGHVPPGGTLTRVDRNGVVFAHLPEDPGWRGSKFPVPKVLDVILRKGNGSVEAIDPDGVPRFYISSRITRPVGSGSAYVILGIPRESIVREGNRGLMLRLSGLGLVMLLGSLTAWFGAETAVLRPIRTLLEATRRFGEGDLSARTAIPPSEGEFGMLAAAFDRMAEAIENRELALREAQQLYHTLVSTSPDAITVTDVMGNIIFVSRMALAMYGHDAGENVVGRSLFEWIDPGDRQRAAARFPELIAGGTLQEKDYRLIRKDGSRFVGEIYASPLPDESGKPKGLIVATRDVTERIRTTEALRKSELRLRAAIENLPFVFWACDAEGRYTLANTLAIRKYGEFVGKTMSEMKTSGEFGLNLDGLNRRVFAGEMVRMETEFEQDGVQRTNDNIISPIRDGESVIGMVSIAIDITERKQAEARREKLEGQLRQSQKMEAVGQLAGGIAHDFNNLMTVVLGQIDLIRKKWDDPLLARRLDEISKAGERAATLTRQLLAFSRRQILQPRIVDLNDVIADIRTILDRLIGDNYAIDIRLGDRLWPVLADPTQIGQVVVNLVVNARDALPEGGTIRISTENVSVETIRPALPIPPGEYIQLSIRDEGTGMDDETKAQLFEPFFTTKDVGKGTGLGLSTVYGIVMQSGGHIEVESKVGDGTTVNVWLPRTEGEATLPLFENTPEEPPHGTETLLLVEDANYVRGLVRDILEEYGYQVLEAENGTRAMAVASAHDGPIDLLLSDMVMPGMSGRKLAETIQGVRPCIKVLFMSGYSEEATLQAGAGSRGRTFLQKPFTPEALGWKVREVLARQAGAKDP